MACADSDSLCARWAAIGECARNPAYMRVSCARSCGACGDGVLQHAVVGAEGGVASAEAQLAACTDEHASCKLWANKGECDANPTFMLSTTGCRESCYACQSTRCHDAPAVAEQCAAWAAGGQCGDNEEFMVQSCPFSCRSCWLNATAACIRDASDEPLAVVGTIEATFERLRTSSLAPSVLHRDPWIMQFDDFLTGDEADELVRVAGHDFQQSRTLSDDTPGAPRNRTSTTSWCNVPSCLGAPGFVKVRERIAELAGVPWKNSEHLQLLRYEEGQYYRQHHDQIAPRFAAWGPRLYTFFMYLSDVDEGGGTRFTELNLTVAPRKGAAIMWPSVLSSDPFATDMRTQHEALPVVRGHKFAANFWMHMYDFQGPHARGCSNDNYRQHEAMAAVARQYAEGKIMPPPTDGEAARVVATPPLHLHDRPQSGDSDSRNRVAS